MFYLFTSLTACTSPKSEISTITFNSPHSLNDDTRDQIIIYELLEPMKSYCSLYYLAIGYNPDDRIKNNDRFFHYGTCLFNIKKWNNIPNLTFRYTTIPRKRNTIFCDPAYLDDETMKTCTKMDDYVDSLYNTIPQDAWEIYTINTQEILNQSIKDKNPVGERPTYFRSNSLRFGKERDRYVELQFYTGIVGNKIEKRLDIGNYWKYQRNTSWN